MMIFMSKKIKYDLVLKNGSVVLPEGIKTADIGIINESIRDIGDLSGADTHDSIDCSGLHVLPGVIDSQVHFRLQPVSGCRTRNGLKKLTQSPGRRRINFNKPKTG